MKDEMKISHWLCVVLGAMLPGVILMLWFLPMMFGWDSDRIGDLEELNVKNLTETVRLRTELVQKDLIATTMIKTLAEQAMPSPEVFTKEFWEKPLPASARIHGKDCPVRWGAQWIPKTFDKELWGNRGSFKRGWMK